MRGVFLERLGWTSQRLWDLPTSNGNWAITAMIFLVWNPCYLTFSKMARWGIDLLPPPLFPSIAYPLTDHLSLLRSFLSAYLHRPPMLRTFSNPPHGYCQTVPGLASPAFSTRTNFPPCMCLERGAAFPPCIRSEWGALIPRVLWHDQVSVMWKKDGAMELELTGQ